MGLFDFSNKPMAKNSQDMKAGGVLDLRSPRFPLYVALRAVLPFPQESQGLEPAARHSLTTSSTSMTSMGRCCRVGSWLETFKQYDPVARISHSVDGFLILVDFCLALDQDPGALR